MCGLIFHVNFLTVNEMRHKFMSDNTHQGLGRAFHRDHVYEDVIKTYEDNLEEILKDYPFRVRFINEKAVDIGGVCRDLFSAFWEDSYVEIFEGEKLYVPILIWLSFVFMVPFILMGSWFVDSCPFASLFLSLLPYFLGLKWRCQTASSSIPSSTTWPLMRALSSARLLQKLKTTTSCPPPCRGKSSPL